MIAEFWKKSHYYVRFITLVFLVYLTGVFVFSVEPNYKLLGTWIFLAIFPVIFLPTSSVFVKSSDSALKLELLFNKLKMYRKHAADFQKDGAPPGITEAKELDATGANTFMHTNPMPLLDSTNQYLLACVDKFVDEAHEVLTVRARTCYVVGASASFAAIGILHFAGILTYSSFKKLEIFEHNIIPPENMTHYITLRIFVSLAFAAIIYAIVKILIAYGSAFFHEATRLLDRRHALRFGRLYMHLKSDDFDFHELQETFQWHMESQTIFQKISPTKLTENVYNQMAKSFSEGISAIANAKKGISSTSKGIKGNEDTET